MAGKTRRIRISAKLLAGMPQSVANEVSRIAADYNDGGIKSLRLEVVPAPYKTYAHEGDRLTLVYRDRVESVEMVSAETIGASGLNHNIGDAIMLPVGATLIRVWYTYSTAGYAMDVINVTDQAQIEGA